MDVVSKTKGTADIEGDHTIMWKMDELGTTTSEGAVLEFSVEHVGTCTGTIEVNESIEDTLKDIIGYTLLMLKEIKS